MSEVTQSILFRQKLYQNFKQSGMLSKLKTSLRTSLLQKLQKPKNAISKEQQFEKMQKKKPLYLRNKFLSCIVRQYLIKSKKQYTLSILLPQSNLQQEDCLNYNELAQITNLHQNQCQHISFLEALVSQWTKFRGTQIMQRSTQTDFSQPVSQKLQDIDNKYKKKLDYWKIVPYNNKIDQNLKRGEQSNISLITKQQRMRQQFQIQKKQIKRQLQLVLKSQIEKKYADKYDHKVRELQKNHEGRLTQMKGREKTILESLNRKTKELEEKANKINDEQLKMIKKYENKTIQLQIEYKNKVKQLENKQKQFWKKQLELKGKKKQYQDTIRLIKQKVVQQTLNL